MKAPRRIWLKFMVSFGLMIIVAMAIKRWGRPAPSHADAHRGPFATSRSVSGPAMAQREHRLESLPQPEADLSAASRLKTSFLRALSASLTSIRSDQDAVQREEKLDLLAKSIAASDLPTALALLQEQVSLELSQALSLRLIRRWTEHSPQAAADWVLQAPPGPMRRDGINDVATVWANLDLPGAVEWVRRLPEGEERHTGLMSVAYEAARTEPTEALKLAMELPANEVRDHLIAHSANQWAAGDPEAAAGWANQIASEPLRTQVLAGIATTWAETDPGAAATLAVKSLSPGKPQDDAVVGIVQRWVQKAPEEAAAWVAAFPEGTLRDVAVENLVTLWADRGAEQAAIWLEGLPLSPSRDVAVSAYVSKVAPLFPGIAARWAESIGDEATRLRQMQIVAETWMSTDVAVARDWIAQATLPDAVKARLLALKTP